ncbi:MAG: hypothetical protein GY795_38770 [Desulfobacterales bacterium]|nr:hypothetical protein [Desulfobacterales bacterium]
MPKKLLLIFNDEFTPSQEADARSSLGVEKIETMPEQAQAAWGNIPPDLTELSDFLEPVTKWICDCAKESDYVLIQGDFGACWLMVNFAFDLRLVPVYSTTLREAVEEPGPDGTVKMTHNFKHKMFREYAS